MSYSRANSVSVVLVIVVAITIVEIHVPRVMSGVLSGRPMAACAVKMRLCSFVTPYIVQTMPRSQPPISEQSSKLSSDVTVIRLRHRNPGFVLVSHAMLQVDVSLHQTMRSAACASFH